MWVWLPTLVLDCSLRGRGRGRYPRDRSLVLDWSFGVGDGVKPLGLALELELAPELELERKIQLEGSKPAAVVGNSSAESGKKGYEPVPMMGKGSSDDVEWVKVMGSSWWVVYLLLELDWMVDVDVEWVAAAAAAAAAAAGIAD
jgi:hypothetical protein